MYPCATFPWGTRVGGEGPFQWSNMLGWRELMYSKNVKYTSQATVIEKHCDNICTNIGKMKVRRKKWIKAKPRYQTLKPAIKASNRSCRILVNCPRQIIWHKNLWEVTYALNYVREINENCVSGRMLIGKHKELRVKQEQSLLEDFFPSRGKKAHHMAKAAFTPRRKRAGRKNICNQCMTQNLFQIVL